MDPKMHIYWRVRDWPKGRYSGWLECGHGMDCGNVYDVLRENGCPLGDYDSMRVTLARVTPEWTPWQRTCLFFGFDKEDPHKLVRLVQFKIKFKKI